MKKLTPKQLEELDALREINDELNGPSAMMRFHWYGLYRPLVQQGLVTWGDPPKGFSRRWFAGTTITNKGRVALVAREA